MVLENNACVPADVNTSATNEAIAANENRASLTVFYLPTVRALVVFYRHVQNVRERAGPTALTLLLSKLNDERLSPNSG